MTGSPSCIVTHHWVINDIHSLSQPFLGGLQTMNIVSHHLKEGGGNMIDPHVLWVPVDGWPQAS